MESDTPAPAHIQAATLQRFLDAWKNWDAEEWLAIFADDFTQVTTPFGLGIPSRSRAEVEQVLPALVATVKSYEVRNKTTLVRSRKRSHADWVWLIISSQSTISCMIPREIKQQYTPRPRENSLGGRGKWITLPSSIFRRREIRWRGSRRCWIPLFCKTLHLSSVNTCKLMVDHQPWQQEQHQQRYAR